MQVLPALPLFFFARPAEQVAPELIGCLLVKRLVEKGRSSSRSKRATPGHQQLPFAFDCRLNQISEEWHQVAVRFRRANGIRDGDRERSIW